MKMDVLVKNKGFYSGVFLGIDGTQVRLQTNHNAGAKPIPWDIREVQAFQTRDGIFAYDEATGTFEPALTFYRFDKAADHFVRLESASDTYLAQDAQVLGAMKSAKAILSVGQGELCLGLPVPFSKSPSAIPHYLIEEVVTAQGVWSYNDGKKAYTCQLHKDLAAEAQKQRDEYWKQRDLQQWDRRVKSYELGTERLKALAPYFWRPWWWW